MRSKGNQERNKLERERERGREGLNKDLIWVENQGQGRAIGEGLPFK
jgi:hypothetical protein